MPPDTSDVSGYNGMAITRMQGASSEFLASRATVSVGLMNYPVLLDASPPGLCYRMGGDRISDLSAFYRLGGDRPMGMDIDFFSHPPPVVAPPSS